MNILSMAIIQLVKERKLYSNQSIISDQDMINILDYMYIIRKWLDLHPKLSEYIITDSVPPDLKYHTRINNEKRLLKV